MSADRYRRDSRTASRRHRNGNSVAGPVEEFSNVFPEKTPARLPIDHGVRHEIDLVLVAKYCVTRQWSLPRDQVQATDEFIEGRSLASHVR